MQGLCSYHMGWAALQFAHTKYQAASCLGRVVYNWDNPADNEANIKWVRDYYDAIHPHSGTDGGYVNFMSADDDDRSPVNYGSSYERLARLKSKYDPDNMFHINQNIVPTEPV